MNALLAVVLVLGLAACGDDGGSDPTNDEGAPPDMDVTEGRQELLDLFEATAAEVAPGVPTAIERDNGPRDCTDILNNSLGTQFHSLGLNVELTDADGGEELLGPIIDLWRDQGFDLDLDLVDSGQPEVLGRRDGFMVRALAVPGSGIVNLAGSTPCLEPVGPAQ